VNEGPQDCWQVAEWNPQGKRRWGRMGLGTACKGETSRMKNVSIESCGGKNYVFRLRKTVLTEKLLYTVDSG
jgi:hypothetical protein